MELNRDMIVKALECCTSEQGCDGCPYYPTLLGCCRKAMSGALALIRELTEENERLEKEVDRLSQVVLYHDGITEMEVAEAKADTVRKMQERLKESLVGFNDSFRYWAEGYIDRIAKELEEENG